MSDSEQAFFDKQFGKEGGDLFVRRMEWMFQERGWAGEDMKVLFSPGDEMGIDYDLLSAAEVTIWHVTQDKLVAYASAQWLAERLPSATFHTVDGGSHKGLMFLFYPQIVESLQTLQF